MPEKGVYTLDARLEDIKRVQIAVKGLEGSNYAWPAGDVGPEMSILILLLEHFWGHMKFGQRPRLCVFTSDHWITKRLMGEDHLFTDVLRFLPSGFNIKLLPYAKMTMFGFNEHFDY